MTAIARRHSPSAIDFGRDSDTTIVGKLEAATQPIDGKRPAMQRINGIELDDTPAGFVGSRVMALEARVRAQDGAPEPPWDARSNRIVLADLSKRIDRLSKVAK